MSTEICVLTKIYSVPLVALETIGSDCFYRSIALNGGRFNSEKKILPPKVNLVHNEENDVYLAHFTSFWSKASGSLGASEPAAGVVKMALERAGGIKTTSVPDELSMATLVSFAGKSTLGMRAMVCSFEY
jgi:L-serine/L-threonine ammonia-lyase